ncbi:hypothetical protein [Paenibacillus koleovorans]|uniref:hypothetical protein n=1 Tax=Paenibacillus koleovorans TaxID=121608 RepID=UPI000FD9F372|nr:hypothetical protein [Paenibacillus koleovorans]
MKTPTDFDFLLDDPSPDLTGDTHLWLHLIRDTAKLPDREKARKLSLLFWYLRAFGTTIRKDHHGTRFSPVMAPFGSWDSAEEFEQIKREHLSPYKDEIVALLVGL